MHMAEGEGGYICIIMDFSLKKTLHVNLESVFLNYVEYILVVLFVSSRTASLINKIGSTHTCISSTVAPVMAQRLKLPLTRDDGTSNKSSSLQQGSL